MERRCAVGTVTPEYETLNIARAFSTPSHSTCKELILTFRDTFLEEQTDIRNNRDEMKYAFIC